VIRYFCDFTNDAVSQEQFARCRELGLEFCREAQLPPQNNITTEIFSSRMDALIKDYWREKQAVLKELYEQADARVANHRKEFTRSKGLFDRKLKAAK